jgi:hypothetical protein
MKRIGLIVTVAFLMPVLFTSCKKDFTCTCTSTDVLGNTRTDTYPLTNQTRPDAVENCENFERDGTWATRNCNL